ncbi:hypothetical protein MHC_01925 [Mycoplasma haemocanis str. Illinois]|uniref:Uncharacterized protein n=1 Tax=Mycoplasma haemocanis (strain Illinois) TaxID=1111676 RepID=H6N6H9_MYCHN|nr:hypothetical protein [Mycoplasma haemocanis]AEW45251.2 hypothetical protein MHC_01925 [Mycoplasma haemocanis str. Illinois]
MLKFFKNRYWMAVSTTVTITATSIGAINFFSEHREKKAFLEDMMKKLEEEERLDEIAISRVQYPENATSEQKGYIDRIIKFERDNGMCLIFFIYREMEGSHYRVDNSFWIQEDNATSRNLFEEFVGITNSSKIANACKEAGMDKKILIKNNGRNVWDYFVEDQSKEKFSSWKG